MSKKSTVLHQAFIHSTFITSLLLYTERAAMYVSVPAPFVYPVLNQVEQRTWPSSSLDLTLSFSHTLEKLG